MSNPEIHQARLHAFNFVYPEIPINGDIYNTLFDTITHIPPNNVISFSNSNGAIKDKHLKKSLNPYAVESLLSEVGSHLEICLKYYFQSMSLREQLESTLLDINNRLLQLDENIKLQDVMESNRERRAKIVMSQTRIERKGGDLVAHIDSVTGLLPMLEAQDKASRQLLNNEKIKMDSLKDKMNTPSSALNYAERIQQLKDLYDIEFYALYRKAYAASIGLSRVYEIEKFKLPEAAGTNALYEIRCWYANVMAELESLLKYDHEFTVHIPLKNGIHLKDSESVKVIANFEPGLNKHYKITIPSDMFGGKKYIRLRGYRIYAKDHDQDQNNTSEFIHCQVQIPNQLFGEGPAAAIPKQLITVPFTKYSGSLFHPLHTGVYNFNPVGEWNLFFPAKTSYDNTNIPDDYYLELILAATHDMGD